MWRNSQIDRDAPGNARGRFRRRTGRCNGAPVGRRRTGNGHNRGARNARSRPSPLPRRPARPHRHRFRQTPAALPRTADAGRPPARAEGVGRKPLAAAATVGRRSLWQWGDVCRSLPEPQPAPTSASEPAAGRSLSDCPSAPSVPPGKLPGESNGGKHRPRGWNAWGYLVEGSRRGNRDHRSHPRSFQPDWNIRRNRPQLFDPTCRNLPPLSGGVDANGRSEPRAPPQTPLASYLLRRRPSPPRRPPSASDRLRRPGRTCRAGAPPALADPIGSRPWAGASRLRHSRKVPVNRTQSFPTPDRGD